MNLEQTGLSLREQFPDGNQTTFDREQKLLEKFGNLAMTGFAVVLAVAILSLIYVIFGKMIWSGTQPYYGLLLVAFITFAGLALAYVAWNESLKEKRQMAGRQSDNDARAREKSLLGDKPIEPVPSVTERTTSKLRAPRN
ncbi:MAG: hypothetical protein WKF34_12440 [Pyrinomonadaceae bacterium]